jgi:excisionase family DNA binding protein
MDSEKQLDKPLYSINDATRLLGVSDDTVRRMIAAKELDAIKVRGRWRIYRESLAKYVIPGKHEGEQL